MNYSTTRLLELTERELDRFRSNHSKSAILHERARTSLLNRVPMQWMVHWAGGFPIYVEDAEGGRLRDVDGHEYVDFCLGDTAAMSGHSPPATVAAITKQLSSGMTFMLPTPDALVVGELLSARFGIASWQFTLSATDANRAAIRYARGITGRNKILVFNHCYHGSVDEAFATLDRGSVVAPVTSLGPPIDPAVTTRVVEFNDVPAVSEALEMGDVAAVLTEPALTNVGIVLPDEGFHERLRDLTRRHGTLLIIDETHTLSAGFGGCTRAYQLDPDIVVVGKAIAGGMPAGAYGFSEECSGKAALATSMTSTESPGLGGTLAANALSLAAMRATLADVLTSEAFERSIALATRWTEGMATLISDHRLPWHVTQLGCRSEYHFAPQTFTNGAEANAAMDHPLERLLRLYSLNRGYVLTPFHNMALFCSAHSLQEVEGHFEVMDDVLSELFSR